MRCFQIWWKLDVVITKIILLTSLRHGVQQLASTTSSLLILVSSLTMMTFLTAITHFEQHIQLNYCYNKAIFDQLTTRM